MYVSAIVVCGSRRFAGIAIGFVAATLVLGQWLVPPLFRLAERRFPEAMALTALVLALGLAWLAHEVGSASIIGAFAAGLLLAPTQQVRHIEKGIAPLGQFFVPLFFIFVGAQVDVRVLNPFHAANWPILEVGGLLLVAAVGGKFAAGYAPFWFKGNKKVVGVGMVPRGEVGLIFAQMGRTTNALDAGLFSAVTLMVMVTTLITPPWLRILLPAPPAKPQPPKSEAEA